MTRGLVVRCVAVVVLVAVDVWLVRHALAGT